MSDIKKASVVKNIIDALGTLNLECSQLNGSACNVYCVSLTNENMNLESYLAAFGRNIVNKTHGLKNILREIETQARKLIPEGTPVDFGNVKPWEGEGNAENE